MSKEGYFEVQRRQCATCIYRKDHRGTRLDVRQLEAECADPSHLKAMCNRCHLRTDQPLHQLHAAETRRLAKEAMGQLALFGRSAPHA